MQQWWWPLVPISAAAIGYAVKRLLERRNRSEALKRKLQALALHNGMRKAGLTLEELRRVERNAAE